jgi:hypothetical protein
MDLTHTLLFLTIPPFSLSLITPLYSLHSLLFNVLLMLLHGFST